MKQLIIGLLGLFAVSICTAEVQAEDIPVSIQDALFPATIKIFTHDVKDTVSPTSAGSGTIVFNQEVKLEYGEVRRIIILTAAHVIEPRYRYYRGEDGELEREDTSTLSLVNFTRDGSGQVRGEDHFVLHNNRKIRNVEFKFYQRVDAAFIILDLMLSEDWAEGIPPVEIASVGEASRLSIGSDLLIAGCPMVVDPVIFRNRLIQRNITYINFREVKFIGHMVARVLTGGNSGGGVYTSDGRLIGIVTLRLGNDFGAFTGIEHILPETIQDGPILKVFTEKEGDANAKSNSSRL